MSWAKAKPTRNQKQKTNRVGSRSASGDAAGAMAAHSVIRGLHIGRE